MRAGRLTWLGLGIAVGSRGGHALDLAIGAGLAIAPYALVAMAHIIAAIRNVLDSMWDETKITPLQGNTQMVRIGQTSGGYGLWTIKTQNESALDSFNAGMVWWYQNGRMEKFPLANPPVAFNVPSDEFTRQQLQAGKCVRQQQKHGGWL